MTNAAYRNLGKLSKISAVFANVQDDVESNQDLWHSWLQSDEPEKLPLPGIPLSACFSVDMQLARHGCTAYCITLPFCTP